MFVSLSFHLISHTHTHTHTDTQAHRYVRVCVCVCVCHDTFHRKGSSFSWLIAIIKAWASLLLAENLLAVIKNSEDETERLEEEIDGYRTDIDKMLEAFRTREKELIDEIDNIQQRNEVLSNLLELVTERADSTGKLIEKYQKEIVSRASAEAGTGIDDVRKAVKDTNGTAEQQVRENNIVK